MFNVGDIVRGSGYGSNFPYSVTTSQAVMEVMGVEKESIVVKILEHTGETTWGVGVNGKHEIGRMYAVNPLYFTLIRRATIDNRRVEYV
jgi:hypothetical protein